MDSLKKNYLYNIIYQLFNFIVPLITTPFISHKLGPNGIGIFSYYYSVAMYFSMFTLLGLNNYGNRKISSCLDNHYNIRYNFWNIYTMQFMSGLIVLIAYLFYLLFFSINKLMTIIMGIHIISSIFDVNWFFAGIEKFKFIVVRNFIVKILTTIMIFVFVRESGDSINIYSLIIVFGNLFSQLSYWPYIIKNFKFIRPSIHGVKLHIKPNLMLFITVLAVSLYKIMDKIMLGLMSDANYVGFYELSERIINIPISLVTALGTVMLPRMTKIVKLNENKKGEIITFKSIIIAMIIVTPLTFGLMAVSNEFVPLFYGDGYNYCIKLYLTLLPSCLFLAFANVLRTQYLIPREMDKNYTISVFIGALTNIILNLLLIPRFKALGASFGTLFAEMSVCVYQCIVLRNKLPIRKYIYSILPIISIGIIMFVTLYFIHFTNLILGLLVKILFGVIIYFVGLILYKYIVDLLIGKKKFTFFH